MTRLVGQQDTWTELLRHLHGSTHIFLTGAVGSGKSTIMREFLQEHATRNHRPHPNSWGWESNDECLLLGPEQDRGIQTIRGQVSLFIRQMSAGVHRWVVIDDADTFPHISQQALRRPMESYSHITRFLFIGTSEEDLIPALRSRCIHLSMASLDPLQQQKELLHFTGITQPFPIDLWTELLTLAGTTTSDIVRILRLLRDVLEHHELLLSSSLLHMLCSTPFYVDFFPLIEAIHQRDRIRASHALIQIWKRGYAAEDVLESCEKIHQMFSSQLHEQTLIHQFLMQAWISYCKGQTSLLSLQHVLYRTLTPPSERCAASIT